MVQMQDLLAKSFRDFPEGSIVKGRVLEIRPREVLGHRLQIGGRYPLRGVREHRYPGSR